MFDENKHSALYVRIEIHLKKNPGLLCRPYSAQNILMFITLKQQIFFIHRSLIFSKNQLLFVQTITHC